MPREAIHRFRPQHRRNKRLDPSEGRPHDRDLAENRGAEPWSAGRRSQSGRRAAITVAAPRAGNRRLDRRTRERVLGLALLIWAGLSPCSIDAGEPVFIGARRHQDARRIRRRRGPHLPQSRRQRAPCRHARLDGSSPPDLRRGGRLRSRRPCGSRAEPAGARLVSIGVHRGRRGPRRSRGRRGEHPGRVDRSDRSFRRQRRRGHAGRHRPGREKRSRTGDPAESSPLPRIRIGRTAPWRS